MRETKRETKRERERERERTIERERKDEEGKNAEGKEGRKLSESMIQNIRFKKKKSNFKASLNVKVIRVYRPP